MLKLCPNITFPHQQDFFPIRSVTKSSTARFSHENLVEKFKIFVQDFVPIRTALRVGGRSRSQVEDIISVVALLTEFIRIIKYKQLRYWNCRVCCLYSTLCTAGE